mmetsp:Transcript_15025/g.38623  ORF Transcript_15025/g.38623 Transcript_15025/m.38623 type:complete len:344 (+) Transcript_15025:965-1996(+)
MQYDAALLPTGCRPLCSPECRPYTLVGIMRWAPLLTGSTPQGICLGPEDSPHASWEVWQDSVLCVSLQIEDGWHQFLGRFPQVCYIDRNCDACLRTCNLRCVLIHMQRQAASESQAWNILMVALMRCASACHAQSYNHSGSTSPFWFSANHGPAHIIVLNPYLAFAHESSQMQWLLQDVARINRTITPWVVGLFHVPWYNSNSYHFGEGDLHRDAVEGVLMAAGVDIVVSGHVHSYERSHPTFKSRPDECGITYLNIGDGGNREGLASAWRDPQPAHSAYREDSYGHGILRILSPTQAEWEWHRNQDGAHVISDAITISRDPACGQSSEHLTKARTVAQFAAF